MKLAICFFGITRNLKQFTLASIEQHLMAAAAEHDPGYRKFGHFNLVQRILNPRTGEADVQVEADEYKLLKCDVVACTDQAWLDGQLDFAAAEKYGDCWEDGFIALRNFLRQLYSLNQVTRLLEESGQTFDVVIYSRADLRFQRKVVIPRIRPGTLYTPWFAKSGGLNDRFAMGDMATMTTVGRRLALTREYCEDTGKPLHAERFLKWYANQKGLRTADLTDIDFCRVRANGYVPVPDANPKAGLKQRFKHTVSRLKNLAPGGSGG
jgi:hypothetical protein